MKDRNVLYLIVGGVHISNHNEQRTQHHSVIILPWHPEYQYINHQYCPILTQSPFPFHDPLMDWDVSMPIID